MGSVTFRIGDKVHMINDEDNKYEPKLFPKSAVIGEVLFVSMNKVFVDWGKDSGVRLDGTINRCASYVYRCKLVKVGGLKR